MVQVSNTFEGGSDGTTITTGNSGGASGDAFQNVNSAVFDDDAPAPYNGLFSAKVGQFGQLDYTDASALGVLTDVSGDVTFYIDDDSPSGTYILLCYAVNSFIVGGLGWQVRRTDRKVQLLDDGGGAPFSHISTTVLPLDEWVRVSWRFTINAGDTTACHVEVSIWTGTLTGTPDEVLSSDAANCNDGTFDLYSLQPAPESGEFQWVDDLSWFTTEIGLFGHWS